MKQKGEAGQKERAKKEVERVVSIVDQCRKWSKQAEVEQCRRNRKQITRWRTFYSLV